MEEPRHPVSGIDYPGTFQDFDKWFSSESACLEFIAQLRWPEGFICPGCGEKAAKPSLMGRGLSRAYSVFIYSPLTLHAVNKEVNFVPYSDASALHLKETSVTDNHWSIRGEKK